MEGGGANEEVVFVVRGQRFVIRRSKLQVRALRCVCVWGMRWLVGVLRVVALLQAHPESLLAKLVDAEGETDGVMVENAGVEPVTIRIDRDPALFARVQGWYLYI